MVYYKMNVKHILNEVYVFNFPVVCVAVVNSEALVSILLSVIFFLCDFKGMSMALHLQFLLANTRFMCALYLYSLINSETG
jgi:hypothetical protein